MLATDVRVIDSLDGLRRLAPEWEDLLRRCPLATPFQSPRWLIPWVRHIYGGGELWTLPIRDGGELIGLAPLFSWGAGTRTVSFLGAGISDYGGILFAPGRESDCINALKSFVQERRREWDVLDLSELPSTSAIVREWAAEPCSVCPVLQLADYPDAMRRSHRVNLRHAHNRMRGHSVVCREATFDEFLPLHEARWGPLSADLQRFHREVAASELPALYLLEVDGVPAAAIYTFVFRTTAYYYLTGYDRAMASLSPGAVLLEWMIERAIAEGLREFNFLRHPEPYKYLWGALDETNYRILLPAIPADQSNR